MPLTLTAAEVTAIQQRKLTQVRVPIKPQPTKRARGRSAVSTAPNPYAPDTVLWVKEKFGITTGYDAWDLGAAIRYEDGTVMSTWMPANTTFGPHLSWTTMRPARTMPVWASRLTVRVVSTYPEVQDGVWYWVLNVMPVRNESHYRWSLADAVLSQLDDLNWRHVQEIADGEDPETYTGAVFAAIADTMRSFE